MPNLLPGTTTLAVLRRLVYEETDQPTPTPGTNVRLSTYDLWINQSLRELTGLLVDSYQNYYVNPDNGNPYVFRTTNAALYPQPNDFFKLLGMDCYWQPGQPQSAVTMRRFMQQERNRGQWVAPQSGLTILVRYVPILPDLTDSGTINIEAMVAGDSIFIAALPSVPQGPPVAGVLPDLSPQIQYLAIANNQSPVDTETVVQFSVGNSPVEAATNLVAAMNRTIPQPCVPWTTGSYAQDRNVAAVAANGSTVTLQLFQSMAIVWWTEGVNSTFAQGVALDPLPIASQWNPYGAWFNYSPILNGFNELVAVDAAIKVKNKQDQDVSVLLERKAMLLKRIESEANNRNAAENAHITDVRGGRRHGGLYGFGSVSGSVPVYDLMGNQIWLRSGGTNGGFGEAW